MNTFKHGMSRTKIYRVWSAMIRRCHNPKDTGYHLYGGRGIQVCERWRYSFANFFADVGERPTEKHSIGRINNDGNYEPGNVRWESSKQQSRNTRRNVFFTIEGRTQSLPDWCDERGIKRSIVDCRLRRGWKIGDALNTPPMSSEDALKKAQQAWRDKWT